MSRWALYLTALLVLIADQASKAWVLAAHWHWPEDDRVLIPGFFSLTFNVNTGGAFGILPHGTLLLALAAAVAAVAIIAYTIRAAMPLPRLLAIALALPLGGAVGNLLDRVRLGHVVDFLAVYAGPNRQWQFPIFNVADSAICIGVGLLALYYGRQPAPMPEPAIMKEKI
ncbi:MAG: signal peptidase II [Janthinobacterium lividum]